MGDVAHPASGTSVCVQTPSGSPFLILLPRVVEHKELPCETVSSQEWENERYNLRVVGYIREASADSEPAFSQSEQIRRWINENGHRLVALCQDVRTPGHAVGREGLQSIVGIASAGQVDAVVVPSLDTLSPDKVSQEVIMWQLRGDGVKVLSADRADIPQLADPPLDGARLLIRDVSPVAISYSHRSNPESPRALE